MGILYLPLFSPTFRLKQSTPICCSSQISSSPPNSNLKRFLLSNFASLAFTLTLNSNLTALAIPSLNSPSSPLSPVTPFSQSKNLQIGLDDRKIRPCPSVNPSCISTNPMSSSFSFPWVIPENDIQNAVKKLEEAIIKPRRMQRFRSFKTFKKENICKRK